MWRPLITPLFLKIDFTHTFLKLINNSLKHHCVMWQSVLYDYQRLTLRFDILLQPSLLERMINLFVFVWSFNLILVSGGCYHEGILQKSLWWNTHRSQKWGDKNKHRGGADLFTALDPCPNCQQVIELKLYL